jgi:thioesterase domain-containing protein/acyl carrier protein
MKPDDLAATDRLQDDLRRLWARLLQVQDLSIDDDFFDRGGDSLQATEMILEVQRLTGKAVPETLLFEASTIRTLTERLTHAEALRRTVTVRLGTAPAGVTPLVYFHGDVKDGGVYVKQLAEKLGPTLPLIVVAPHVEGIEPLPPTIEAMAADRLPAILKAQPEGPYRLGGFCLGGAVALETARLLIAQGHEVEAVVMIDSAMMENGECLMALAEPAEGWDSISWGAVLPEDAAGHDDVSHVADDANQAAWKLLSQRAGEMGEAVWYMFAARMETYAPAPLSVPLLLFSTCYDATPWSRLSPHSELFACAGGHYDWVIKRSGEFATILRDRLQRITAADRLIG